jgi:glyoxylase-like metal-dependent hydrolase (beta-lactamase superfamily II)
MPHHAVMGRDGVTEVADDVLRVCVAEVNCYLLRTPDGLTLFDAGLPGSWGPLNTALRAFGAEPGDIAAVLLTHAHFDHVGLAARLARDHRVPVLVHPGDARLARHPYRYRHERARLPYLVRYPRAVPTIARMARHGALGVRGVEAMPTIAADHPVPVPGAPLTLWTPGHTDGHCGFLLREHGVILTGDALVTLDPYTGRPGPQIVAAAATADVRGALASLDAFAQADAVAGHGPALLLPGHGAPWIGDPADAVAEARAAGGH